MRSLELQKITEGKYSPGGLNRRMDMVDEESLKPNANQQKLSKLNKNEKKLKINEHSRDLWDICMHLTFVPLESEERRD